MLHDIDYRNINMKKLFSSVAKDVLLIWSQGNPEFCPPVVTSERSLAERIEKSWNTLLSICHGRETKVKIVESWTEKLDKVFDIVKCKCNIILCSDAQSTKTVIQVGLTSFAHVIDLLRSQNVN